MLHAVLVIAAKDLRQRLRDRSALVLGFAAPLLITALMNAAFSGADQFHATLGVVDADTGEVSQGIVEALRSPDLADVVTVEVLDSEAAARRAVDGGDVDAALVIPERFSERVTAGSAAELAVLSSVDAQLAGEVARSIAVAFTSRLSAARLTVVVAAAAGTAADRLDEVGAAALAATPPASVVDRPTGDRTLEGVAYFGPSMAMFFVLFAIGFTARGFFEERREGTLDRMAAAPIAPSAVLLGKALSVFAYALTSLLTMSLAAAVLFDASWGSPIGVVVLCVAMAASVVSVAALVMAVAHTERQAETLASAATFTLALLGGNFLFVGAAPPLMRRMATLTPNGWALRGFTDLGTGVGTWAAVAQPVLAMVAFTVVVGLVATWVGRTAVIE